MLSNLKNFASTAFGIELLVKAFVFLFLLGIHLTCVRELVQEDVLAAAEAKLENIFFFELIVALGLDTLVVQVGAIARTKVNNVRSYPSACGAICPCKRHQSILEYRMLLGAGWVVNGDISNFSLPPQQIGTLSMNVHDWKGFIILEGVQSPSPLWNASLRWFVVLDHHSPECVGVFCECP